MPAPSAQEPIDCAIKGNYPNKVMRWCDLISKYAEKRSLPPDLIAALIVQESGGNPAAYSSAGAVGLMQVMPRDGIAASFGVFGDRPTMAELQDPEFNISYGTKLLAWRVQKYGLRDGLKSYGPMGVDYYYADKVLAIMRTHAEITEEIQ